VAWTDKTINGGPYDKNKPETARGQSTYWACEGSVTTTSKGQVIGFDRYNKCFRPCSEDGKQWAGSPEDVQPTGDMPTETQIGEYYVTLLSDGKCFTDLIAYTGYKLNSIDRCRVVLSRINTRLKKMLIAEHGEKRVYELIDAKKLKMLTGVEVQKGYKIKKASGTAKQSDEEYGTLLNFVSGKVEF